MTEDRGEIKIRYTLKQGKREALSSETVHIFPVSRWKIYLIVAPTFVVAAFLSILFFSVLLPLVLGGGLLLSVWIWRTRRKLRDAAPAGDPKDDDAIVDFPRMVQIKSDTPEVP